MRHFCSGRAHMARVAHALRATGLCIAVGMSLPALAQGLVRVDTPGTSFTPKGSDVTVDDVPGGRRFRGQAFATVIVQGTLKMPASRAVDHKMHRLAVHFRTSPNGPTLTSVAIPNTGSGPWEFATGLQGDYMTRDAVGPKGAANSWDFKLAPPIVGATTVIRLQIQFPGGFDSVVDTGEFVLKGISVDFERNPRPLQESLPAESATASRYGGSNARPISTPSNGASASRYGGVHTP